MSILLDGGDEFQGTPVSNLAYGRPVVDLFRELDVSAAALGNHEFDWGVDTLRARVAELRHAMLGANVRTEDGRPLPWLRDDTLVVRGGLRIGIVGVADPGTPRTTKTLNVRGLRFGPMAPAVDARARALRARGADVVVVVAHVGAYCDADRDNDPGASARQGAPVPGTCQGEVIDLARELTERVDAIVSGHTHSRIATIVNGIPITQGRSSGRGLGVIDIPVGPPAGGVLEQRAEMREVVADGAGPTPPAVDAIVRRAAADVAARVERRIGESADALPRENDEQYALGNLVADAQRWAANGDVAIMNNGGIRTALAAGPVTFGALYEVQPFGNTLYRLTVRGRELRAHLARLVVRDRPRWHVSGVLLTYDTTRTGADRLVSATLADGRPIADDQTYTVILNDFLVTGGDGLTLAEGAVSSTHTEIVDVDALARYVATLPQPFRAPGETRIRAAQPGGRP